MDGHVIEKETRGSVDQDSEDFATEDSGLITERLHQGQDGFKRLPSGRLLVEMIMLFLIFILSGLLVFNLKLVRSGLPGFGPSCKSYAHSLHAVWHSR